MHRKTPAPRPRKSKALSGWHPEDIKAAIRKKGTTLTALSEKHEYSDSYLRGTLIRRRPHGEEIIAEFLGVTPAEIWPERYKIRAKPANGRSKRPRRR